MRYLTASEAAVLRALMADVRGGDRERLRAAGVPRTTYQVIRRRALEAGWISSCDVPDLARAGLGRLRFTLAQPFAERHAAVTNALRSSEETLLLWSSRDTLFRISRVGPTHPSVATPSRPDPDVTAPAGWWRHAWSVEVSEGSGAVPIFLDFEGAWSRSLLGIAPLSYPRSLGWRAGPAPRRPSGGRDPSVDSFLDLLAGRGGGRPPDGPPGLWASARERRLRRGFRELGWLERRFFLVPWKLPEVRHMPLTQLVFVTGRFKEPGAGRAFLARLLEEDGASPFLLVYDHLRVVTAALASPTRRSTGRPSVLRGFESMLTKIEVVREPLSDLASHVDLRFRPSAPP